MKCAVCLANLDTADVRDAGTVLNGTAVCLVPDGDGGYGDHFTLVWSLPEATTFRYATLDLDERTRS